MPQPLRGRDPARPDPRGPAARRPDDARHSVLRKARPISQSAIESFTGEDAARAGRLPRDAFGHYNVKEVDVKTALTRCRLPGEPWSLNPFTGCSHACAYCYVPDVAHVQREKWGAYVIVKRNLPFVLAREMKRREPRPVFLSSATDPYQPAEATHRITRRALEILRRHDWPLSVLTRNPLIRRDVDLLTGLTDVRVGMSVPTLDDAARRLIEPGAPPVSGRLRTLGDLADAGLPTFANLAPCYPLSGDVTPRDVANAFANAGVGEVYAAPWRYLGSVLPVIRERLDGTAFDVFERAVADRRYYERLFTSLAAAFRRAGVPFNGK